MNICKNKTQERANAFITNLLKLEDKGIIAAFRRADNVNMEYQSWPYLVRFGVDLEKTDERLAFVVVSAAVVRAKIEKNGIYSLGQCLAAACNKENSKSITGEIKLRRLLGCRSVEEVCRILRPLLGFITESSSIKLDYALLLQELLKFRYDPQRVRVKTSWAQKFYQGAVSV